jgi:hypothetical protein
MTVKENNLTFTKENTFGDKLVKCFDQLTLNQWKSSLYRVYVHYRNIYEHLDEGNSDQWTYFIDLVATYWGYYGDLDIYIPNGMMDEKMQKTLNSIKTRKAMDQFVKAVGDHQDRMREHTAYLVNELGYHVMEI